MIDLGDVAVFTFEPKEAQASVDPATVTLTIGLPDGTTVTPTPAHPSVGLYRVAYTTTQVGRHDIRWVATGPASARSDVLNVAPARTTALASLEEFKQHLNMTDSVEDDELRRHLEAATAAVERHLGQVVVRRTVTETHTVPRWGARRGRLVLNQCPVLSLTSVTSSDGVLTWDTAGLLLDSATGEVSSGLSPAVVGEVTVTYVAGYAIVPAHIVLAAQIIAAHLWELQRVQVVGPAARFGEDTGTPTGMGYAIPNRAVELLGGRPPVIA